MLGLAVLSHQQGTVGHRQEAADPAENSPGQEDGEAGREGHGEPAQGGGQAGAHRGEAGPEPAPAISAQQRPGNGSDVDQAGCVRTVRL